MYLQRLYHVGAFADHHEFLSDLARRGGKLDAPDQVVVARLRQVALRRMKSLLRVEHVEFGPGAHVAAERRRFERCRVRPHRLLERPDARHAGLDREVRVLRLKARVALRGDEQLLGAQLLGKMGDMAALRHGAGEQQGSSIDEAMARVMMGIDRVEMDVTVSARGIEIREQVSLK